MFCSKCGNKMEDTDVFCQNCGTRNDSAAPVAQPAVQQVAAPVAQPAVQQVAAPVAQPAVQQVTTPVAQPVVQQVAAPVTQQVAAPAVQPVVQATSAVTSVEATAKPKKKKSCWSVVIAILAIVICAEAAFIAYLLITGDSDSDKKDQKVNANQEATTLEDATTVEGETTTVKTGEEETTTEEVTTEEPTTEEPTTETPDVKKVTLDVWGNYNMMNDVMGEGVWLDYICNRFKELHPEWDITFNFTEVSEGDAYNTIVGYTYDRPDVFLYSSYDVAKFVDADILAPLDSYTKEKVKFNNAQSLVDTVTYDGELYGLPYAANAWVMYYDTSVYDGVDITSLEAMMEVAPVGYRLNSSWYATAFFLANGCTFSEEGFDFGGEKAEEVVQFLIDNLQSGKLVATDDIYAVSEGTVSAFFGGYWDYDAAKLSFGDNLGVAMLPKVNFSHGDGQLRAMYSSNSVGVCKDAEDMEVAMAFARFMASEEAQQSSYFYTGTIPCHNVYQDAYLDEITLAMQSVVQYTAIAQPYYLDVTNWWSASGDLCSNLVNGLITDVKEAVEVFNNKLNGLTE